MMPRGRGVARATTTARFCKPSDRANGGPDAEENAREPGGGKFSAKICQLVRVNQRESEKPKKRAIAPEILYSCGFPV